MYVHTMLFYINRIEGQKFAEASSLAALILKSALINQEDQQQLIYPLLVPATHRNKANDAALRALRPLLHDANLHNFTHA